MPGDAADDMYDAEMRSGQYAEDMLANDCKPCPKCTDRRRDRSCSDLDGGSCPVCADLGWIDADGNPAEC